ncbi:MAG: AmmeMemoRadiSam system protein A [Desulfatiglans sp.]|jgi:AmmeMemoRadiSam system protein A|nr:AmmeMemoRadiSam system protein A [Thermodesulfobacteriota bacterium]MEE4352630.1 AmmeMemoRadiSam system protein A [Desulfatiglans sp.]
MPIDQLKSGTNNRLHGGKNQCSATGERGGPIPGAIFCFSLLFTLLFGVLIAEAGREACGQRKNRDTEKTSSLNLPTGVYEKESGMTGEKRLTEKEGRYLLALARETIEAELFAKKRPQGSNRVLPAKFDEQRGTFVTLTIGGGLRGCIGHIIPHESLLEGIRINAINAAFRDPRFRPISKKEWKGVKIEISILTDPEPLSYSSSEDLLEKLTPDIDGVILKKGHRQSTFLPQVWEQLPEKEEFLTHLCIKAGLDGDAWKERDLEISIYQVQAFEEE